MMPTKRRRWYAVVIAAAIVVTALPNLCKGHNNGDAKGGGGGDGIGTNSSARYLHDVIENNYNDFSNAIAGQKISTIPMRQLEQEQQHQQQSRRKIKSKTNKKDESGSKSGKVPTYPNTTTSNNIGEPEMAKHHGSKSSKVSKHNIWEGGAEYEEEGTDISSLFAPPSITTSFPQSTAPSNSSPSFLFPALPTFDYSMQPSSIPSYSTQPTSSNRPSSTPTMTSYPSTSPRPTSLVSEQPFFWSTPGTSPPTAAFQLENASSTPLLPPPSPSSTTDNSPTTTDTTTTDGNGSDSNTNGAGQIDRGPDINGSTVLYGKISFIVSTTSALIMIAIGT